MLYGTFYFLQDYKKIRNYYIIKNYFISRVIKMSNETKQYLIATPLVGIIMGSVSDASTMKHASEILDLLKVPYEMKVVSAHRTPERMMEYAKSAEIRGLEVIIAGAGGAAHLPGMVASITYLPVLGVPVQSRALDGMDSLLSIVQMPKGVPVGTLAIGESGAINAALLASAILAGKYPTIKAALHQYRRQQTENVPDAP
jgi:5-(carboxyamino)imidazole ribonucleotide mutase